MDLANRICDAALSLGFDLAGIAPPWAIPQHLQAYHEWLSRGDHGTMGYMARPDRVARREDISLVLPRARSVVCVGVNYYPESDEHSKVLPLTGSVSRYAWGRDYHDWMLPRLEELASYVASVAGVVRHRAYVDTGPLLERSLATQAGLGFVGRNTCLINPRMGSYLFLGELILDLDLAVTGQPMPNCGTCSRCLEACPTGALAEPYRLDARRCISYLTIELKGPIPRALRPHIGHHIYGCDTCQEVCPWQRFARLTPITDFQAASHEWSRPSLADLMGLDEERFQNRFKDSPILRIGRGRLLRNVAVALGNSRDPQAIPVLESALADVDPLVRAHSAWALARIGGKQGVSLVRAALEGEADPLVKQELAELGETES